MFKIYVINLNRSTARLAKIAERLDQAQLSFERIAAVDGKEIIEPKEIGYDQIKNRLHYGRRLTNGEIGCYASHIKALKAFLEENEEYCLILEDDAIFPSRIKYDINTILNNITSKKSNHFYTINLCNTSEYNKYGHEIVAEHLRVQKALVFPTLATGLLWSRIGAERFLEHASTITMPFDHALRDWLTRNSRGYSLDEAIILSENLESEIGAGVRRSEQSIANGLLYDFIRAARDFKLAVFFLRGWARSFFGDRKRSLN